MNRKITENLKIPESIRIPYFGGKWYNFLSKIDNRKILNEELPTVVMNTEARDETVTISLTSYPARINKVHLAIKSLMLQSYKPDRIVLWLAENQFPDYVLPTALTDLVAYGLEIRYIAEDLLGHKKHVNAIMEQKPNELVLTYDDDIIYPINSVEKLINKHRQYPGCIICNRAQEIVYQKDGKVTNPGRWKTISNVGVDNPTYQLLPSNGGGVLYPYRALSPDSYNAEKIKALALRADDLWMMFMALEKGTKTVKTVKYHKTFTVVSDSQNEQLATGNIYGNAYIDFFNRLIKEYPDAWSLTQK